MLLPDRISSLLIDREAYRVCPLLAQSDFIRFCNDRNVGVARERLLKLERLKLFFPILRIYRIDTVFKVEYLEGGKRFRDLGDLKEGEEWKGDTRTRLAGFDFSARVVRSWREYGNAWDPRADVSPHIASLETEPQRHEAYYSPFQITELDRLVQQLTVSVEIEWAVEDDGAASATWGDGLKPNLSEMALDTVKRGHAGNVHSLAVLCQLISDRYYPKTQSDERHITLREGGLLFRDWDWYQYCRAWDAAGTAKLLDLQKVELKNKYEKWARMCRLADPLDNWHELVRFVSLDKRKKLKGDALKAQTFGEMAKMLRLFHMDAFGEVLASPGEIGTTIIYRIPDVTAEEDPTRALELVANDFGINPKPQLVLFVEGTTESTVVPLIFDGLFASKPNVFGIELVNLGGIGNATGGKDNLFSALWRLVDYLHHHQTISFILLDNEGLAARNIAAGLPRAQSLHFPDRRATRPNYVKLWKLSFELDNFNDAELASALEKYSEGHFLFSAADVKQCRDGARNAVKNKKVRTLDVLYAERTGKNLNKPRFGQILVQLMFDPATKRKAIHRPIAKFLDKVAEAAALNHQPTTQAVWEYNQRTGHLGTLRPGAIFRRKNPFGDSRKRRRGQRT
jgi:hypothetical protein